MITTKGEMDVAWCTADGQVVALLEIPPTVDELPGLPGFCCVRPVRVLHCHFVQTEFPPTVEPASLPEYLTWHLDELLLQELTVHRSVVQHGAIQYIRRLGDGGVASLQT